jgi:hypothetical protein
MEESDITAVHGAGGNPDRDGALPCLQLFAIIPMSGQGTVSSQLGSMLAGPSVVPEAQMLGAGPEMYNCMGCTYLFLPWRPQPACVACFPADTARCPRHRLRGLCKRRTQEGGATATGRMQAQGGQTSE